jgi:hypothetical protein
MPLRPLGQILIALGGFGKLLAGFHVNGRNRERSRARRFGPIPRNFVINHLNSTSSPVQNERRAK